MKTRRLAGAVVVCLSSIGVQGAMAHCNGPNCRAEVTQMTSPCVGANCRSEATPAAPCVGSNCRTAAVPLVQADCTGQNCRAI